MGHNARILAVDSPADIADEMRRVGAEAEGIARMLPKAQHYILKVEGVSSPLAHILKEGLLSVGGEAVISHDALAAKAERTDALLIGSAKNYASVTSALKAQGPGGAELASEIETALGNFNIHSFVLPDDVKTSPRVRAMFEAMGRRTLIMGILNVTPDSFSDGGLYLDHEAAVARAARMMEDGADIVDVGGESTRPGSEPVSEEEEARRVIPAIERLRAGGDAIISVDTCKSAVALAALAAGADIVNDISGMSFDPQMRAVVAEAGAAAVLMHVKGTPKDMQRNPTYSDLLSEVTLELRRRVEEAVAAGVDERLLIVDPGFGFGKTPEHNLLLLRRLREFKSLGRPILVGASRKSTIGKVLGDLPPEERLEGTAATVAVSIMNGADIVRVHDVREMARVARMTDAVVGS